MTNDKTHDEILGEQVAAALQRHADRWVGEHQVPARVVAIALATTALNLAVRHIGREGARDWLGDLAELLDEPTGARVH